jgi:hypothetical protein
MSNVIPTELRNSRGLKKLREFYAEQVVILHGDENTPQLEQLRSDICCLERELSGEPFMSSAVQK